MPIEILTKEDLQQFRLQLLNDLKEMLNHSGHTTEKKYLRSSEVRKLLSVSAGTLQNLRISGALHPTKIGGTLYYRKEEIEVLLRGK